MPGLLTRLKFWKDDEQVTHTDLNAEFDNIITYSVPGMVDSLSHTVTDMRADSDPGEPGSETQASTMLQEMQQVRFQLAAILGEDYWYSTPDKTISQLLSPIVTPTKRILSGRVDAYGQPMFLSPVDGVARVVFQATETPLIAYISGGLIEFGKDLLANNLGLAPATANTCLVNDSNLAGDDFTKYLGEGDSAIPVDNVGAEISAKAGTIQTYKLVHGGSTEYFLAEYDAVNSLLRRASRGHFFDSTDAPISRLAISNDDVITLMRTVYVFALDEAPRSLAVTYDRPAVSFDAPTNADYWFDLSANTWKRSVSGSFQSVRAAFIGIAALSSTAAVAARSADFSRNFSPLNDAEFRKTDSGTVAPVAERTVVSVYGKRVPLTSVTKWNMADHLESGVTEAASTTYFMYLGPSGERLISDKAPHYRQHDLFGAYHPHKPYRCVASVFNDSSSNFLSAVTNERVQSLLAPSTAYDQTLFPEAFDATDVLCRLSTPEKTAPSALSPVLAPLLTNVGVTSEYSVARFENDFQKKIAAGALEWSLFYTKASFFLRKSAGIIGTSLVSGLELPDPKATPVSQSILAGHFLKGIVADVVQASRVTVGESQVVTGGTNFIRAAGATNHGSDYTRVRRFADPSFHIVDTDGTVIASIQSSAELGTIVYINRSGIWSIHYQDSYSLGKSTHALSTQNSNIFGIYSTAFDGFRLAVTEAATATKATATFMGYLAAGQRVYPLTTGDNDDANPILGVSFIGGV